MNSCSRYVVVCTILCGIAGSVSLFGLSTFEKPSVACFLPVVARTGLILKDLIETESTKLWTAVPEDGGGRDSSKSGQNSGCCSKGSTTSSEQTASNSVKGCTSSSNCGGWFGGRRRGDEDDPDGDKLADYESRLSQCNDTTVVAVEENSNPDTSSSCCVSGRSASSLIQEQCQATTRGEPFSFEITERNHLETPSSHPYSKPPKAQHFHPISEFHLFDNFHFGNSSSLDIPLGGEPFALQYDNEDSLPFAEQEENDDEVPLSVESECSLLNDEYAPSRWKSSRPYHQIRMSSSVLTYPPDEQDWTIVRKKRKCIPVNVEKVDTNILLGLLVTEATDLVAGELSVLGFDPSDQFALALVVEGNQQMIYIPLEAGTIITAEYSDIAAVHIGRLYQDVDNKYVRKVRQ